MGFQSRKIFDILAEECTLRGVFSATERRRGIMRYRPIRRNSEFGRVYARGKSYVNPGLVMYVLKTRSKKTRVGLTATKKIGHAVQRNRARRVMKAAIDGLNEGAKDGKRPMCIGVTQLTSTSKEAMNNELGIPGEVIDCVIRYAKNAKEAGLDGVVCSVHEAKAIHEACGEDFLTVTPGIRLASDSKDDQKRVATPAFAKEQGCDYIVVGRSITKSANPVETYKEIEATMSK